MGSAEMSKDELQDYRGLAGGLVVDFRWVILKFTTNLFDKTAIFVGDC